MPFCGVFFYFFQTTWKEQEYEIAHSQSNALSGEVRIKILLCSGIKNVDTPT